MSIRPRCDVCGYDFYPETGFYLGAMCVSYLVTAIFAVPPMLLLYFLQVSPVALMIFPFVELAVVGVFLTFYARVVWLHFDHSLTDRLGGPPDEDA